MLMVISQILFSTDQSLYFPVCIVSRHAQLAETWLPQWLPEGVYGAKTTPSADVLTYHTCQSIEQAVREKLLPAG